MEETIISSDSHVIEVPDLWEKGMPSSFKERAPKAFFDEKRDAWMFGSPEVPIQAVGGLFMAGQRPEQLESFRRAGFSVARPGGWDPIERMKDMVTDGVAAEVLYPSLGLGLYCIEDAKLQEALFRTYNDWVINYCQKVPDRLYGIALISMFDIDHAIAEMERCKKEGIVGTMIWQVPHDNLPFTSDHYERFWAASQDLDLPVHLHILTGFGADRYILQMLDGDARGAKDFRGLSEQGLQRFGRQIFEPAFVRQEPARLRRRFLWRTLCGLALDAGFRFLRSRHDRRYHRRFAARLQNHAACEVRAGIATGMTADGRRGFTVVPVLLGPPHDAPVANAAASTTPNTHRLAATNQKRPASDP